MILYLAFLLVSKFCSSVPVEEFQARDPSEFHNVAMSKFMEVRRVDPNANLSYEGEFMKRANKRAIDRMMRRDEEELTLTKVNVQGEMGRIADGKEGQLALPGPSNGEEGLLAAAVNQQGTFSQQVMLPQEAKAMALEFTEEIGLGAISKAGALPLGSEGQWLTFAEKKLKNEESLDYQALLWELGSECVEKAAIERGGLNISEEISLMANLSAWFVAGGGQLGFVEPTVSQEHGFQLIAQEELQEMEAVIKVPLKLVMCRQTARNVVIPHKGKYLGEELNKAFDKDEVWGMVVFVLHEYYKEVAGKGSKWGPYLRTLRMRALSTAVVQELKGTIALTKHNKWLKDADGFMWWSVGSDGPCSPVSGICRTKPEDRLGAGDSRFTIHQIRWAYWVVRQNAVRIRSQATGLEFISLIPYYNMLEKRMILLESASTIVPPPTVTPQTADNTSASTFSSSSTSSTQGEQKTTTTTTSSNSMKKKTSQVNYELDGSVTVRISQDIERGRAVFVYPGNFSDSDFYLRYLSLPDPRRLAGYAEEEGEMEDEEGTGRALRRQLLGAPNPHTEIKLKLPGVIPRDSKFHYCVKGTQRQQNRDDCKASYRSESMFWKSKVLTEWRQLMALPPRLQELRMWAVRLHLYGGDEEMKLLSQANSVIAGLPLPTDQMAAEDQLMMLGLAKDNLEAALIAHGGNNNNKVGGSDIAPQLYTAPDPTEDWEADRAMQNLATLALQAQRAIASNNLHLNATQVVLNATRDFFQHGVLPMAGLDELDYFLLKKIGMLAHCGFENDMKMVYNNISEELFCAMRVHLMNESEIFVFCPKEARVWEENCLDVMFMNYTAISERNERDVVEALRRSIETLLASYPTTFTEDLQLLSATNSNHGPIGLAAIKLRAKEKEVLLTSLEYLAEHEKNLQAGLIPFQLAMKAQERVESDLRAAEHAKFVEEVKRKALVKEELAFVEVTLPEGLGKANLTLVEGEDISRTVTSFLREHNQSLQNTETLVKALRGRIVDPPILQLLLGVIIPATGQRKILGIPEQRNATVETGIFCAKYDNSAEVTSTVWCQGLLQRVEELLAPKTFLRQILLVVPIDAPDGRKLKMVIREGEQHDLMQLVSDFFEYYKQPMDAVYNFANEVHKRLPAIALQIPVGLTSQRQVSIRLSLKDNVTNVVNGFVNFFELDDTYRIAITKRALHGMAPGTYMV